jgi:hypothetical protein
MLYVLETSIHPQACTDSAHSWIFLSTFLCQSFNDIGLCFVYMPQDEMGGGVGRDN